MPSLPQEFFGRPTLEVARALLGQRLVRVLDGQRLSGLIAETEAYLGPADQASHAYRLTPRSAIMYGPPGYAYVYFIYGRNFCLNAVTEAAGKAGAVLIRALIPREGLPVMRARRGLPMDEGSGPGTTSEVRRVADGPGKLCQALAIDRTLNGRPLTSEGALYIEPGIAVPEAEVVTSPRIGVRGDEETRARPWRFLWRPPGGTRRA